jgi:hypothetical protein
MSDKTYTDITDNSMCSLNQMRARNPAGLLKPASREETWKALSPDAKKLMKHLNEKFGIEFLQGEVK